MNLSNEENELSRCYKLINGKDNQMNWTRAQTFCQQTGGDLLVIRSEKEVIHLRLSENENLSSVVYFYLECSS